ncbi:MAG: PKD domain-containing protein, partial [Bacteroidetes bacterium]
MIAMKAIPFCLLPLLALMACQPPSSGGEPADPWVRKHLPSDHFFLMRSWPDTVFPLTAYEAALHQVQRQRPRATRTGSDLWTVEGPANIGGRINTVAIHPSNPNILLTGSASGGIHRSTDGGQNWTPVFDDKPFLAIGHISFDPGNPDIVYAGTGDPNISGYPFIGDGVYKSTDGGQSWTHMGLTAGRITSKIFADPSNSNILYAGMMGLPFARNNDRGLYKSTDGGQSWTQVLFVSDQAGVIDLLIDPVNPQTIYAATWDRIRNNAESTVTGPHAGIWKSTDGGNSWTQLLNGLPTGSLSRIGLAMSGLNPQILFALVVAGNQNVEGVYTSTNGGASWTNITGDLDLAVLGGFGWYFGKIRVNPTNNNELWVLGVDLWKSADGGTTWNMAAPPWWQYDVHADKHDLQFDANGHIYLTTDGGLYKSTNGGNTWADIENLTNTQFYRVAVNPHDPSRFYGGAQDNGSTGGNAAQINNWPRIWGGDGFQMRFDPSNAGTFYAETQNGGLVYTTDGGNNFSSHRNGIDVNDRRNWDMPFILSPQNPQVQYTGTYRVYRNTSGPGGTWQAISPQLTLPVQVHPRFHTITCVEVSPLNPQVLYAGTTDAQVQRSLDGGATWTNISAGLPTRYVTDLKASPVDSATLFVSHSGYKDGEYLPHVHRSTNYGNSWTDISGNLPDLAVNDLFVYPSDDDILFAATDGGVYGTIDGGQSWSRLGTNMPLVAVYDLEIEPINQRLVAGTYGRSIMTFPLGSFLPPPRPELGLSSQTLCTGDSLVLTAPSGYAAYLWTTGDTTSSITVSTAGQYAVQVRNAYGFSSGFSDSVTVFLAQPPAAPVLSWAGDSLLCPGSSLVLRGPAGFAGYFWSDGSQGSDSLLVTQAGSYRLVVVDSLGCSSDSSQLATASPGALPVAAFGTQVAGLELTLLDSSLLADTYFWDLGDGHTSTDSLPTHTYPQSGSFVVTLVVGNACGQDTFQQTVTLWATNL